MCECVCVSVCERKRRGKMQCSVCVVHTAPSAHPPEPLDDVTVRRAVLKSGVDPPVVHVHLTQPRDQQLQLSLVKVFEQVWLNELVETFLQRQELLVNAVTKPKLQVESAGRRGSF